MEFSLIEVGDFTIKEFHQIFFPGNFDIGLWDFISILKAIIVLFLLHFDSCPAETIIIWLTKQMNTLSNKFFRVAFVKLFGQKKVASFLGKWQRWNPDFKKLHDNVSKTGLRHRLFSGIFPILEQPLCRAHVSIPSWSFDTFLVFKREALLCSLLELATHKSTKEQLLRNVPEKRFIGNVPF